MTKILAISRGPPTLSLSSITGGNTTLTLTASNVDKLWVGMIVTGDGIPALTRITAIASTTTVTLSSAATDSTTANRTFEKVAYNCPTNPKLKVIEAATLRDNFIAIYNNSPITNESNPSFTALNNTAMNGAITENSNAVTVASTNGLYVGQSVISTSDNFPINTVIEKIVSSTVFNTNNDSNATVSSRALKLGLQLSNLETTSGFRLKCFDSGSSTGYAFTSAQATQIKNETDNYYFVLIHSDNYLKHHFARITEINYDDIGEDITSSQGDSFDFEPKLGSELPIGTKFKLYSFPIPAYNHPVAISAGVLSSLNDSLVCSHPLFYFFNEYLDKKNELDHNEKYAIRFNTGYETSAISFDSYFMTMPDYGTSIVDYSRYSMNLKLVDRLKDQDDPLIHTSNESVTVSAFNPFDRDSCFLNAKRDGEGALKKGYPDYSNTTFTNNTVSQNYVGPDRYLQYGYSPTISNFTENVMDCVINESVGMKGGYAEIKVVDSSRMLTSKIPEYSPIRIRHHVHRASFMDWMPLPIFITNVSSHPEYSTSANFDISSFLSVGDEVRVGKRILIVKTIDAFSGFTQDITFEDFTRLETESVFTTTTYSLAVDDVLYRRAYNQNDNTLLTDYPIFDGRESVLYVILGNPKLEALEATVIGSDADKKLLTLKFFNASNVLENSLAYANGSYSIEIERLNGEIERIESASESRTNMMTLQVTSQMRKLISPIINKNTLFSQDIVYSSDSPYNKLTPLLDTGGNQVEAVLTFALKTITWAGVGVTATVPLGTTLFGKHSNGSISYVGRVKTGVTNSATALIEDYSRAEGSVELLKSVDKHYIFNKALASNPFETSTSSLDGVSNKGLYFESGTKITHAGITGANDGKEESLLSGSSISDNSEARGYFLSSATKIKSDLPFQAKLDNLTHTSTASFDTINTLMDFTVIKVSQGDSETVITVAPYIPLTLGRVDINYANQQDTLISKTVLFKCNAITSAQNYLTEITDNSGLPLGGQTLPRQYHNKPVFVAGVFVGLFVGSVNNGTDTTIYLDRNITDIATNSEVSFLDYNTTTNESSKLTHELNFLNGAHLHTGKIISLLYPKIGAVNTNGSASVSDNTLSVFDMPLAYSATNLGVTSYSQKFGSAYYRLMNIEKGNFNLINSSITGYTSSEEHNFYGQTLSNVNYYSSGYRFNPGFYIDGVLNNNITGTGKTNVFYSGSVGHDLVESRGHKASTGSRYGNEDKFSLNDSQIIDSLYIPPLPNRYSDNAKHHSFYIAEDVLDNLDPKISRMFLFSNCDLLPYSGSRIDSLFNTNQTRDLTKYNIMLINEPTDTDSSDLKTNVIGETKRLTSRDAAYTVGSIKSASKSVGSDNPKFTNFSVMRLTEMVLDFAFNQFDPENPPTTDRVVPSFNLKSHKIDRITNSSSNPVYSRSISGKVITFSGAPVVAANDVICDDVGHFMGIVASVSGNDVTCDDNVYKTVNTTGTAAYYAAASGTANLHLRKLFAAQTSNADGGWGLVSGHGAEDTFIKFGEDINLLKTAIMVPYSNSYSEIDSAFYEVYNDNTLHGNSAQSDAPQTNVRRSSLWLPIDVDSDSVFAKTSVGRNPWKLADKLYTSTGGISVMHSASGFNASNQHYEEVIYEHFMPIILNRFTIEESGTANASIGMCAPRIAGLSRRHIEDSFNLIGISVYPNNYASLETSSDDAAGNPILRVTSDTDADGILMGLKPILVLDSNNAMANDVGPNNTTLHRFGIPDTQAQFLSFVDLTGCYLAPENGKYLQNDGDVISLGTQADRESLNEVTPNSLIYILSHELDTTNATKSHILTVDSPLQSSSATVYRILQPNHTCFHDASPNTIKLNELSSKYTQKPDSTEMYSNPNSFFVSGGTGPRTFEGEAEAVLSMYVIADPNDVSTSDHVVIRTPDKLANIWNLDAEGIRNTRLVIADGENVNLTDVRFTKDTTSIGYYMNITKMKKMIGIPSVSEPIELTVDGKVSFNAKRALIGSVASICRETEDLIEETLLDNNIDFSLSRNDSYPFFIAPNFQGVNLFSAINFLMSKKNKSLTEVNGKLTILDRIDSSNFSHVNLSPENSAVDIFSYEKVKTMFDYFNHIIVLGQAHKSVKKNLRSINKHGIKSLQEYDSQLVTQEDVNKRAIELLRLHSDFNFKITIEVGHKGVGQLKAGDIVSLELPQENVEFAEYLVLQITHTMRGMLILELGKYSKQLEDRFAEIAMNQSRTISAIRDNKFDGTNIEFDFIEETKLKLIKFIAQKRSAVAGIPLGFTGALNTGTYTLGHVGAGTVSTVLLEEEF